MSRPFILIQLVLLTFLLLLVPLHGLAQDTTPEVTPTPEVTFTPVPTDDPNEPPPVEPPPEETPVTTPGELLGQLYALLKDATYIAWAAAGVVIIVGLIKAVAGAAGVAITNGVAVFLTLVVQVLIWLGYAIANYFNAGEAFQRGFLILVDIARSLLPLVGAIFGGHVLYRAAAKRGVPVLGYRAPHTSPRPSIPPQ